MLATSPSVSPSLSSDHHLGSLRRSYSYCCCCCRRHLGLLFFMLAASMLITNTHVHAADLTSVDAMVAKEQAWVRTLMERQGLPLSDSDFLADLLNMDHLFSVESPVKEPGFVATYAVDTTTTVSSSDSLVSTSSAQAGSTTTIPTEATGALRGKHFRSTRKT